MVDDRGKLYTLIAVAVVLSTSVSVAITVGYMELGKQSEVLMVDIDTDKPPMGVEPLTLNLTAIVLNARGKTTCEWNFGNGEEARGREVTVTYDEPGTYSCTLTVTDEAGRKATDSLQIIVEENKPPVISLSINTRTVDRPFKWLNLFALVPSPFQYAGNQQEILDWIEERKGPWAWGDSGIVITAKITDPEGDEIVSYKWREQTDDKVATITGKTFLPVHNLTGNETVKIPTLYAWIRGRHIVTLTVKDSNGNEATAQIDYFVTEGTLEMRLKSIEKIVYLFFGQKVMEWIWNKLKNAVIGAIG